MSFNDDQKMCTTTGEPVDKVRTEQTETTGQHKAYIVLCEEERQKGFVRPYRDAYTHVGRRACWKSVEQGMSVSPLFCLMEPGHSGHCGALMGVLAKGCGSVTTMGRALSETYARDPKFYGATFCVRCNKHLPVAEFVWTKDGEVVGS